MEPYSVSVGLSSKYTLPFSHLDKSITRNVEYYPETSYPPDSTNAQRRESYDADWLLRKHKPPFGVYPRAPLETQREIHGREGGRASITYPRDLAAGGVRAYPNGDSFVGPSASQQLYTGNAQSPRGEPYARDPAGHTVKLQRQSKEGSYMDHPMDAYPDGRHGNLPLCSRKNVSTDIHGESFSSLRGTSASLACPSVGPFGGEYPVTREAPLDASGEGLINLPRRATLGDGHPFVRGAPFVSSRDAFVNLPQAATSGDEHPVRRKVPLVACRDASVNLSRAATIGDERPFRSEASLAVGREASISLPWSAAIGDKRPSMSEAPYFVGRETLINLPHTVPTGDEHPFMREAPFVSGREVLTKLPRAATAGDQLPFVRDAPFVVGKEPLLNVPQAAPIRDELPFRTEAPFVVSRESSSNLQRATRIEDEHPFMRECHFVVGREASMNIPWTATVRDEHPFTREAPFVVSREEPTNLRQAATGSPCKFHLSPLSAARFSDQEVALHESVNVTLKRKHSDDWSIRDDKQSLSFYGRDFYSGSQEMENNNPGREQRMDHYSYKYLRAKPPRYSFNKDSASGLLAEDESDYMQICPSEAHTSLNRSSRRQSVQYDNNSAQKLASEQACYRPCKLQKRNDVYNDLQRPMHNNVHGACDEFSAKDDALPTHGEPSQQPDLPEDSEEFKKRVQTAYLRFAKLLNENQGQKRRYLEQEKHGSLRCIVCGRFSEDFVDTHTLVLHAYNSKKAGRRAEHMGLHRALCVLMGWSCVIPPDNTRSYQSLASPEAGSNKEDLIVWPPLVIVHNACTGKGKDGRWEGIGNPEMDELLKDLGFGSGKSKALYGRDGHQGIILVKFLPTLAGLQEAERLHKYFEGHRRGRKDWLRVQSLHTSQQIDDDDPDLVRIDEKTKEKMRVLYGYVAISVDLDKVDFDTRKRALVKSRKDIEV